MCFTPPVSLGTAIVEFFLAGIMRFKFTRARLRNFFAFFLIMLGFYQFTEFMLCTSKNAALWVRAGYITYTFLPALGVHAVLNYFKVPGKINRLLLYIIPVGYTVMALLSPEFVQGGSCQTVFILTKIFYSKNHQVFFSILYDLYYFSFMLFACLFAFRKYWIEKDVQKKKLYVLLPIAISLMSVPPFIVVIVFPFFHIMFPSVLCHFAILLAITVFIEAYLEHKLAVKENKEV